MWESGLLIFFNLLIHIHGQWKEMYKYKRNSQNNKKVRVLFCKELMWKTINQNFHAFDKIFSLLAMQHTKLIKVKYWRHLKTDLSILDSWFSASHIDFPEKLNDRFFQKNLSHMAKNLNIGLTLGWVSKYLSKSFFILFSALSRLQMNGQKLLVTFWRGWIIESQ